MKRLFSLFMCLGLLIAMFGCSSGNTTVTVDGITSYEVDMSGYEDLDAENNNFRGISPQEFIRVYEEGGSGVFYIGYTSCSYCQVNIALFQEAAEETGTTIYYLDAYSEEYDFFEYYEEIIAILEPILRTNSDGEATIYTPHIFALVNGSFGTSLIGGADSVDEVIALMEEVLNAS